MVGIRGRGAAAAAGAAEGALKGFLWGVDEANRCSDDFCGIVVFLMPFFVGLGNYWWS
jgi:hypothetical protein